LLSRSLKPGPNVKRVGRLSIGTRRQVDRSRASAAPGLYRIAGKQATQSVPACAVIHDDVFDPAVNTSEYAEEDKR
jgi:hypothetical protein